MFQSQHSVRGSFTKIKKCLSSINRCRTCPLLSLLYNCHRAVSNMDDMTEYADKIIRNLHFSVTLGNKSKQADIRQISTLWLSRVVTTSFV